MDVMKFARIPYLKRGRTFEGCDCYGFVRLFLIEAGIAELPAYEFTGCGGEKSRALELIEAEEVQEPEDYDVVYLLPMGRAEHVGVYHQGRVWQMTRNGPLSRPWKMLTAQVKGVYRVAR